MTFTARALAVAAMVSLGLVAVVVLVGPRFGYQYAVVKSGSMAPTYPVGTIVMTEKPSTASIKAGNVISWEVPGEQKARVSHRVVEVVGQGNQLQFRTKGDANEEADARLVNAREVTGRVIFAVPFVGRFTPLLQHTGLAFGLVFVCGAILIAMELEKIYRELRGGKSGARDDLAFPQGVIRDFEP